MMHRADSDTFFGFPGLNEISIEAGGQSIMKGFGAPPNNRVLILSGGAAGDPNEENYPDLNFFVSGSIGSKDTSTRGTAVFGGDVVTSGSLFVMTGSNQGIVLESPNGTKFYLTVDNAGNLSTSAV